MKLQVPDPPEGLEAANPGEWLKVWNRVIATTPTKAVGYACATQFADWNTGAEIRPGDVILSRICGCSTKSVQRAFKSIRNWGLMWRYHKGMRQGDADEYRLTIPDDTLFSIPVLSLDWKPPDCESAPDSESADTESAPDCESAAPDTESGAHRTQSPPTSTRTSTRPPQDMPAIPTRPDVERLCAHLADRIEANGSPRPQITKRWRDAARLMLDNDGRTEQQVITAINWSQEHEFWRANILSMPKLREKYDQLRLQAQRPRQKTQNGNRPDFDQLRAIARNLDAREGNT